MRTVSSALILGAALAATPAAAQDEADNSGVFVGVLAGLDVANLEVADVNTSDQGLVYGLTVGYDIDTGSALLGLEAEVAETTLDDTGLDIYAGARLGLEMDDNDVIYLKAGYTNVDIDFFDNLEGFRVGAGVEHNFGVVALRGEYRYSGYDSDDLGADINTNRHQIVLTLGGKF